MHMQHQISEHALPGVRIAQSQEGLAGIHEPDTAAVFWHREIPTAFHTWINALSPSLLPEVRVILPPSVFQESVQAVFEVCGTPDCVQSRWLMDDIAALGTAFTKIMQARYLRLRLNIVTGDSCRRFHTDAVRARLICTYRGAGTQYAYPADDAPAEHVHSVPTGCPVILRGTDWPETPASGLRHRSPPIEGTGETRLIMVLDPIDNPEDEV